MRPSRRPFHLRRGILSRSLRRGLVLAAMLLAGGPLLAYVIVLKDGTTVQTRAKYKIVGDQAEIILLGGATSRLPLKDIDIAKTDAANVGDRGDARVVAAPKALPTPTPTAPPPTLADLIAQRRNNQQAAAAAPAAPVATPPPALPSASTGGPGRTPAGYVDLLRAPRVKLSQVALGTELSEMLRKEQIETAGLYDGTQPGRILIEFTTNSEGAVFQAIAAAAKVMLQMEAKNPSALEAIEVFMATDRRSRAGQFLLTPERATELATNQVDVQGFFVKYVEF